MLIFLRQNLLPKSPTRIGNLKIACQTIIGMCKRLTNHFFNSNISTFNSKNWNLACVFMQLTPSLFVSKLTAFRPKKNPFVYKVITPQDQSNTKCSYCCSTLTCWCSSSSLAGPTITAMPKQNEKFLYCLHDGSFVIWLSLSNPIVCSSETYTSALSWASLSSIVPTGIPI